MSTTEAHGSTHLDEDLSHSYRSRGKYFFRYVLMSSVPLDGGNDHANLSFS